MDSRVHFITFATADLDAARRFYVGGLGWQPLLDVPGEIIFFQVGPGLVLGLFDLAKFDQDLGGQHDNHRGCRGDGLAQRGQSRGGRRGDRRGRRRRGDRVKAPQFASFGGYHAHFQDPNGVIWEVAHNPGWSVDDSGTVQPRLTVVAAAGSMRAHDFRWLARCGRSETGGATVTDVNRCGRQETAPPT